MREIEKSKWYWIGRLQIALDLYQDRKINNQSLKSELINLYNLLESEEGEDKLKKKPK